MARTQRSSLRSCLQPTADDAPIDSFNEDGELLRLPGIGRGGRRQLRRNEEAKRRRRRQRREDGPEPDIVAPHVGPECCHRRGDGGEYIGFYFAFFLLIGGRWQK